MSPLPRREPRTDVEKQLTVESRMTSGAFAGRSPLVAPQQDRVGYAGDATKRARGAGNANIKHWTEVLKPAGVAPSVATDPPLKEFDGTTLAAFTAATGTIVEGRDGRSAIQLTTGTAHWDLGADKSVEVVVGFAFSPPDPMSGLTPGWLVRFYGDAAATIHLSINLAVDGTLSAVSGATTIASSAAGAVTTGWQYVEVLMVLGDAELGLVQVRVDGAEVLSDIDCDTRNGGTVLAVDRVAIGSFTAASKVTDGYLDAGPAWAAEPAEADPTPHPHDAFASPGLLESATDGSLLAEDVSNVGYTTETGEPDA